MWFQLAALVAAGAGIGGLEGLLIGLVLAGALAALVLRRADWLEGSDLVVRRLRTRRVDLSSVRDARVRSVPAGDHRVLELVLVDARGHRAAVPVWRTRSPRGVDVHACTDLADRLLVAPASVVRLLRAQGEAVRDGVRPTPLDRWVPHELSLSPADTPAEAASDAPRTAPRPDRLPSRDEVAATGSPGGSRRTGPPRTSRTGSR